jgi:hypothetical protein
MRMLPTFFFAIIFVAILSVPSVVLAQQNDSSSSISGAQNNLIQCYDAVKSAEFAGANVSKFTSKLNDAGLLLSDAKLAFANGNFGSAQDLAVQSNKEIASLFFDANSLKTSATQSRTFDFLLNIVGSVGGTIGVLVVSYLVWGLLKRKYGNSGAHTSGSEAV